MKVLRAVITAMGPDDAADAWKVLESVTVLVYKKKRNANKSSKFEPRTEYVFTCPARTLNLTDAATEVQFRVHEMRAVRQSTEVSAPHLRWWRWWSRVWACCRPAAGRSVLTRPPDPPALCRRCSPSFCCPSRCSRSCPCCPCCPRPRSSPSCRRRSRRSSPTCGSWCATTAPCTSP